MLGLHTTISVVFFGEGLIVFGTTAPPPQWARASSLSRFLYHTQRRTTVGRNPLDERSARRRDLVKVGVRF